MEFLQKLPKIPIPDIQGNAALQRLLTLFSVKHFLQGAAGVALIYIILFVWIGTQKDNAIEAWENRAPTKSAIIQARKIESNAHASVQLDIKASPLLPVSDPRFNNLYITGPAGDVPTIRYRDNVSVFDAFKRPFDLEDLRGTPVISLAIAGVGLSETATHSAIRSMPPEISLIFSPYTADLQGQIDKSRARGHETWLVLPLETENYPYDDPGPETMIIGAPERQNHRKLNWLMSRAKGVVGFVGQEDSIFLAAPHDMRPIMGYLFKNGLAFVNTEETPSAVLDAMAAGMHAPYTTSDLWIDKTPESAAIRQSFVALEKKARETGHAIGLIHPYPVSYREALLWLKTLEDKGFILAPLSAQAQN